MSKSGFRTTEFWLSSAATLLGLLLASGVFDGDTESVAAKIVGGAVSILAALGYTASRTKVKAASTSAFVFVEDPADDFDDDDDDDEEEEG